VAVSCRCHEDTNNVIPPLTAYYVMKIGSLPLIPYFRPGDKTLAEAVRAKAKSHSAVLLANHGPVVAGKSLEDAVYSIEELEETAKLQFLLEGKAVSMLNASQIAELNAAFPS
jgi:ribulose-5-phosphate 4-epimerase/fuculose-1-phosphate aldolase